MKRKLFLFILFAFLSGFWAGVFYHMDTEVTTQEKILFFQVDEGGDDYGSGTYVYPTHQHFAPHEGLFDLLWFKVLEKENYYYFLVSFQEITNPWRARYGFSHQLIQIYIDNEPGGSTTTLIPGANVTFSEKNPWNYLIKASGWGIDLYHPGEDPDEISRQDRLAIQLLSDNQTIQITLPKEELGSLDGAAYYLLIGSFDVFGQDNYREVKEEVGTWHLGGGDDSSFNPNVLDLLTPKHSTQKEMLGDWSPKEERLALLYPVGGSRDIATFLRPAGIFLFFLLALILLFRVKKNQYHW